MVWIRTTPAAVDKSTTGGIHTASTDFIIRKLPTRQPVKFMRGWRMAAARRPARSEPVNIQFFFLYKYLHRKKGWLFSDTQAGAHASATIYSLVQTAKANRVEPYSWLRRVLRDLPAAQTPEQIEALLPWNLPELKVKAG